MRHGAFFASIAALAVTACTVTSTTYPGTPTASGPPDPSKLPAVSADALGAHCSGFGTSPGQTALFPDDDCGAGSCLVDARTGLDLYCSADCTKVACPAGYTCSAVDHPHGGYACFRDENGEPPATTHDDAGAHDGGLVPAATNPDGVAYPDDHIGWKARSGNTRGDRIANLAFSGFAPGSSKKKTVSLADFFDPTAKHHDVVWLVGASLWDSYTQQALRAAHDATSRIAVLAVLGDGRQPATTPTASDFNAFHAAYTWPTTAFDPGWALLKPAFDVEAVPLTIVIDARTMEITKSGAGSISTAAEVDQIVSAITARVPSY